MLEILMFMISYRSLGIRFSNRLQYYYALRVLGGVSENQGSLKDMQWLPHVRPLGRGVTFLILMLLVI